MIHATCSTNHSYFCAQFCHLWIIHQLFIHHYSGHSNCHNHPYYSPIYYDYWSTIINTNQKLTMSSLSIYWPIGDISFDNLSMYIPSMLKLGVISWFDGYLGWHSIIFYSEGQTSENSEKSILALWCSWTHHKSIQHYNTQTTVYKSISVTCRIMVILWISFNNLS